MTTYVNFLNHNFFFLFSCNSLLTSSLSKIDCQIVLNRVITGTYEPSSTTVLFHEPARHSNLAIRARRVRPRLGDDVRGREDQPLRMEQPSSLSRRL